MVLDYGLQIRLQGLTKFLLSPRQNLSLLSLLQSKCTALPIIIHMSCYSAIILNQKSEIYLLKGGDVFWRSVGNHLGQIKRIIDILQIPYLFLFSRAKSSLRWCYVSLSITLNVVHLPVNDAFISLCLEICNSQTQASQNIVIEQSAH